jgi:hypothetical protein
MRQMKRIHTSTARIRRERRWPEDLPDDPRDPDVVRAKALARQSRLSPGRPGALGRRGAPG